MIKKIIALLSDVQCIHCLSLLSETLLGVLRDAMQLAALGSELLISGF